MIITDADFMLFTNVPEIVECARRAYEEFPTVVNELKESGITYNNTKEAYAEMDSKLARAQRAIGESSNIAQLCVTYYCTELNKENPDEELLQQYYENFVILAVLAQIAIDGCKREYEVDPVMEIQRIKSMSCMDFYKEEYDSSKQKWIKKSYNFPMFMKYTKEIAVTKNGKERDYNDVKADRNSLESKINPEFICPMNWLQEYLDKIQNIRTSHVIPTVDFFIKYNNKVPNARQMSKIREIIEQYDGYIRTHLDWLEDDDLKFMVFDEVERTVQKISKVKISGIETINRLIETALGLDERLMGPVYKKATKYTRRMLNMLYKSNKDKFLQCFKACA